MKPTKAFVRSLADVPPVDCPCGLSRRVITGDDNDRLSVHRVTIRRGARMHYHKVATECYVVLEGTGQVELDGERLDLGPGDMVYIPPPTRHAVHGDFEIINIVSPPFDPADEYVG